MGFIFTNSNCSNYLSKMIQLIHLCKKKVANQIAQLYIISFPEVRHKGTASFNNLTRFSSRNWIWHYANWINDFFTQMLGCDIIIGYGSYWNQANIAIREFESKSKNSKTCLKMDKIHLSLLFWIGNERKMSQRSNVVGVAPYGLYNIAKKRTITEIESSEKKICENEWGQLPNGCLQSTSKLAFLREIQEKSVIKKDANCWPVANIALRNSFGQLSTQ